jgi:hypothetical protein
MTFPLMVRPMALGALIEIHYARWAALVGIKEASQAKQVRELRKIYRPLRFTQSY